jgi:hypothetical protein
MRENVIRVSSRVVVNQCSIGRVFDGVHTHDDDAFIHRRIKIFECFEFVVRDSASTTNIITSGLGARLFGG